MSTRLSEGAHAAISLRAAARAVTEARAAWKKAAPSDDDEQPTTATLRDAFRLCTLAARATRSAVRAYGHDAPTVARLVAEAHELEDAAADLRARLAKSVALDAAFA